MPKTPEAARRARAIFDWRASRAPRTAITVLEGVDIAGAYDVQDALVDLLREAGEGDVVGYKIALTSATMQQMCGVSHPLAGALLASRMHASPAEIAHAEHLRPGVECEVAVRLGADLPASGQLDRTQVAQAVDACAPAFELVEDGLADYDALDAAGLIADNCWNAANVLGAWVRRERGDWLDSRFTRTETRLRRDGVEIDSGRIGDAMGHPFEAVAWVANLLAARGRQLRAGMVVMTGSSVRTLFPDSACRLDFSAGDLGEVSLHLR